MSQPVEEPRGPREKPFKAFTGETKAAIEYWDASMANPRMVLQPVTARKYIELYRAGLLKFQQEGGTIPDSYPTLEEAEAAGQKKS